MESRPQCFLSTESRDNEDKTRQNRESFASDHTDKVEDSIVDESVGIEGFSGAVAYVYDNCLKLDNSISAMDMSNLSFNRKSGASYDK